MQIFTQMSHIYRRMPVSVAVVALGESAILVDNTCLTALARDLRK